MSWLKKTWAWLDKKKMAIGTVALFVSSFFPQHTLTYQILDGVGKVFGGVGFLHKAVKKDFGRINIKGLRKEGQ